MALSSSDDAHVAQLMKWLRSDQASADAVQLREELAYLLFYGDPTWANNDDDGSISDYRAILASWFADDSSSESRFLELTDPDSQSEAGIASLVSWFTPLVEQWKQWAKSNEGNVEKGIPNPNFADDRTPGTEYYWYDPDNEVYLYAGSADAPDDEWLSYEDRRYTAIAYDDVRKTNYRQDRVTGDFELQSRVTPARWLSAGQWDAEAAAGSGAGIGQPQYTVAVYDAGFQMYRRFNSASREYEYADDAASKAWLTLAQANEKRTGRPPALPAEDEQQQEAESRIGFTLAEAAEAFEDFADALRSLEEEPEELPA